jgi:hypothetical protein
MYDVVLAFPKMKVAVTTREERVAEIRYLPPDTQALPPRNALAERAARQLERYRDDPDARFDLPLDDRRGDRRAGSARSHRRSHAGAVNQHFKNNASQYY